MRHFSVQTITLLVDAVTGGSFCQRTGSIGKYRSASEIEMFLGAAGIEVNIGGGSRVPTVKDRLTFHNQEKDGFDKLKALIEQVVDPREYFENTEIQQAILEQMNVFLKPDGYELRTINEIYKLYAISTKGIASETLQKKLDVLDYDSVSDDFRKALSLAESDPPEANKSACSLVESVCKCILDEMQEPYPTKQDIKGLCNAIGKKLNLHPERTDIEKDVKMILSGLSSVAGGIGALRTHDGAHGRGKNTPRIDSRIARLSIHAASTLALFLIETWHKRQRITG